MAQEDPDNQDTTFDFVTDEMIEDNDEKIDDINLSVKNMKQQLGLYGEANQDDTGVQNY